MIMKKEIYSAAYYMRRRMGFEVGWLYRKLCCIELRGIGGVDLMENGYLVSHERQLIFSHILFLVFSENFLVFGGPNGGVLWKHEV